MKQVPERGRRLVISDGSGVRKSYDVVSVLAVRLSSDAER